MYALDIETTGLDCRIDRITSVAVYNPEVSLVSDDTDEARLLIQLRRFILELEPGQIVTWNGAVFDGPFLHSRATGHGLQGMFPLRTDRSITPKYEPQRGFGANGYHLLMPARDGSTHTHSDMAYVWKDWAVDNGVTWSLKPVAKALGIEGVIEVDRENVHRLSVPERMAYNLSDVVATYRLAEMATQKITTRPWLATPPRHETPQLAPLPPPSWL